MKTIYTLLFIIQERHIEVPDLGLLPTLGEFLEKYQHLAMTDYYNMCEIYP